MDMINAVENSSVQEESTLSSSDDKSVRINAYMRSYSARRNRELKWMKSHCMLLARELLDSGKLDELSDVSRTFMLEVLERWPRKLPPLLLKLYGKNAHVGSSVTARFVLETIYKSKNDMTVILKRWRKAGIDIAYKIDPEGGPLDACYVIEALPFDLSGGINMTAKDLD